MDLDSAKKYIVSHALDVLELDNASRNKTKGSSGVGYVCPVCSSGKHSERGTGITTKDNVHFSCWAGCYTNSDIIDILAKRDGLESAPFMDKLKNACKFFNIQLDQKSSKNDSEQRQELSFTGADETDYLNDYLKWHDDLSKCDYLTRRGISQETQDKFLIGYCENWVNPNSKFKVASPRLIIPNGANNYLARDIRNNLTDKQKQFSKLKVGNNAPLFNAYALIHKKVFVVEGEIDALSIIDLGFECVALGSTSNRQLLVKELTELKESSNNLPCLILALDNDAAGTKATLELREDLEKLGCEYFLADTNKLYDGCKDANESLLKDRDGLQSRLERYNKSAQELYNETSAKYLLNDFEQSIISKTNPKPISTGFKGLDKALDGGLYEGLYFIGAISSLGKTTFSLQIADNVARMGHDVLIFSLEMSKRELMAKSVSRLTFQDVDMQQAFNGVNSIARSTRDLISNVNKNNDKQLDNIKQAIHKYSEFAERIFILEGLGDVTVSRIRNAVAEHIVKRGVRPIVFIDYLQIIAPHDERATDKQNTDKAVLELKRISRDYKIPVFAVSSLNRQNYNEPISMLAFKESGAIEYSSDVLLGLQLQGAGTKGFDVDEAKSQTPRQIELKILKNRNGLTGGCIEYEFYSKFNTFDEVRG